MEFKDLVAIIKANGWNPRDSMGQPLTKVNCPGYYGNGQYRVFKSGYEFCFTVRQSNVSCAIPSMYGFKGYEACPVDVMQALIRIPLIVDAKQGFYQAVTLSLPEYKKLNKAMELAGFVPVAEVPTRMDGDYKNYLWQWYGK